MLDGDGERKSLRLGRLHAERRDGDDEAGPIEERPAAVPGIDRGIGLHHRESADVAHRADDAARDRVLQAERRSERHDFLAGPRASTGAHRQRRLSRIGSARANDGDVELGRADVHPARERRAVGTTDGDGRVAPHDVSIGQQRIGCDEETAAKTAGRFHAHDCRQRAADHVFQRCGRTGGRRRGRLSVRAFGSGGCRHHSLERRWFRRRRRIGRRGRARRSGCGCRRG